MTANVCPRLKHVRAPDGYELTSRVWSVDQPLGRVVCLHGIISHSGWYLDSCAELARAGFDVHFLERRGSGLNASERGDVNGYQTWLDDLEQYLTQLPHDVPKLLFGISWGGKLATALVRRRGDLIHGLALICPGLFAKKGANVWQRYALPLAARTGLARRRVDIPLRDPGLFTDAPHWKKYIRTDPLVLRQVTIRFAWADQQLSRFATGWTGVIDCPVLLMLAGRDRIIDNQRVSAFVQQRAAHTRLVEYRDAAHTFEFDDVAERSIGEMVRWAQRATDSSKQQRWLVAGSRPSDTPIACTS